MNETAPAMAMEGARNPEIEAGEFRELAVHVCVLCWDGSIRLPLAQKVTRGPRNHMEPTLVYNRWKDQGIDLFYDSQPVMKSHLCPSSTNDDEARGVWQPVKIRLPASFYQQLMGMPGAEVEPGTAVDTHELQEGPLLSDGEGEPLIPRILVPAPPLTQVKAPTPKKVSRAKRRRK